MSVFGNLYAAHYDELFSDVDYDALYRKMAGAMPGRRSMTVLDVGCGTGEFSRRFAADGHRVVGVDPSADMLAVARSKCAGLPAEFIGGTAVSYSIDRSFDLVLMAGAVLGYQVAAGGAFDALCSARRHLAPGGSIVLDVWNAEAVRHQGGRDRQRATGNVARKTRNVLFDHSTSVCTVEYEIAAGDERATETHRVRYFNPDELCGLLVRAGFPVTSLTALHGAGRPTVDDWHMMAVAIAR